MLIKLRFQSPSLLHTICAFSLIGGAALFFITSGRQVNPHDEGLVLTGAFRILHGEWPSRDFYTMYGPAQFFVVAAMFKLLGANVLVSRAYDSVVAATIVLASLVVVRQVRFRVLAATCALAVVFLLLKYRYYLYPVTSVIFLILIISVTLTNALTTYPSQARFLTISILITAVFLFRYDLGIIAVAAFGVPILIVMFIDRKKGFTREQTSFSITQSIFFLVVCLVGAIVSLAAAGILLPALHDILKYNTTNYAHMRALPWPGIRTAISDPTSTAAIYFPLAAGLFAIGLLFMRMRAITKIPSGEYRQYVSIIVFLSCTLFFYLKGIVRVSPEQMLISDIPAVILTVLCLDEFMTSIGYQRYPRTIRLLLFGPLAGVMAMLISLHAQPRLFSVHVRNGLRSMLDTKSLEPVTLWDQDTLDALNFVLTHTDQNERILSATGRHDKVFVNDNSFYFLSQRLPATRWAIYDPGVQTSEAVQREMVGELDRYHVKYIVQNRSWDDVREDNASAVSSGVLILDNYISASFRQVQAWGKVAILERRQSQ